MTQCTSSTYCCNADIDSGACDCGSGDGTFSIPVGNAVSTILLPASTSKPASSHASASSATQSTTSSTSNSVLPTSTSSPEPSSNTTAIGAGVGVPVGVLAIAGIAFGMWWRLRTRRRRESSEPASNQREYREQNGRYPMDQQSSNRAWSQEQHDQKPSDSHPSYQPKDAVEMNADRPIYETESKSPMPELEGG